MSTRFRVILPNEIEGEKEVPIYGQITADNAQPILIGDTVKLTSEQPIRVQYVDGSAVLYTTDGRLSLPDTIVSDGALIGYKTLDGRIPGSFDADVVVQLKIQIAHENAPLN